MTGTSDTPAESRPRRKRRWMPWLVILLAIALALLVWWLLQRKDAPPAAAAKPLAEFGAPTPMDGFKLCPGLQIVTAISQPDGDYESIKTVEGVTPEGVRIRYSAETRVRDVFADNYGQMQRSTIYRMVRTEDMKEGRFYAQRYFSGMPETIPGATAIGTSTRILEELKSGEGATQLDTSNAYSGEPGIDREVRPNIYDYVSHGQLRRTTSEPEVVLVDDRLAIVPTVRAKAEFIGETGEFTFLDDPSNPLTLAFRLGVKADGAGDDTLNVIKIARPCDGAAGAGPPEVSLADLLAKQGRAAIYDIYFAFGAAEIRGESAKRAAEIAAILKANPGWRLKLEGHTDNIGDAKANTDLSRRRAESLKAMLVSQYGVDAARLETAGLGPAYPRADNTSAAGRARNRRIEIQRL